MNFTIKPLTPELIPVYLDFFDNRAFSSTDANGPCYCTSPMQTSEEIDKMVSEFAGDVKGTIRRYAAEMLNKGEIHGYLAFDGNAAIGWCNAGDMCGYIRNRYQFIPDFAYENAIGKTMSVVCFSVAPEYRGKGVSTALLKWVLADAEANGYTAVEGYIDIHKEHDDVMDFKGPIGLYKKLKFTEAAHNDSRLVMRKILRDTESDRITIRTYRPTDSLEIADLFYKTVHSVNAADYSPRQLDAWAGKDKDARWWESRLARLHTVVAEKGGIIIGFGSVEDTGFFDLLYVHKEYQRMGAAALIADTLEKYIFGKGTRTITTESSITAKPFFEQRGYVVLEKQTVETNGQQLVNFKMKKDL